MDDDVLFRLSDPLVLLDLPDLYRHILRTGRIIPVFQPDQIIYSQIVHFLIGHFHFAPHVEDAEMVVPAQRDNPVFLLIHNELVQPAVVLGLVDLLVGELPAVELGVRDPGPGLVEEELRVRFLDRDDGLNQARLVFEGRLLEAALAGVLDHDLQPDARLDGL